MRRAKKNSFSRRKTSSLHSVSSAKGVARTTTLARKSTSFVADVDQVHRRRRFDFVIEDQILDDGTRTAHFSVRPDPRRYEERIIDGEAYYYDKLDEVLLSKSMVERMIREAPGLPFDFQNQSLGDAATYVGNRRDAIRLALKNAGPNTDSISEAPDDFLESRVGDRLAFVILSVDLVGSTSLSTTLPAHQYVQVIKITLYELADLVPRFHGYVLKYTGDGLIAYFPAPSFVNKNDLAIDCALTMRRLVRDALNPVLIECGYKPINIRIGLDAGDAAVIEIGSPATKRQKDIIGAVVNIACKIQARAPEGEIAIGEIAVRNLHTSWRLSCSPLDSGEDWVYKLPSSDLPYPIYLFNVQEAVGQI